MMLTTAGLLILYVAAELFEHRRFQRILGILSAVFAVVILLSAGLFALDVLQVRNQMPARGALAYKVASATAMAKWGIAFLTLAAFGWASLRSPSSRGGTGSSATKEKRSSSAMLV